MKRTITSTTICLLVTLLLIRTGPLLVEEDLLLHTNGLCHLNFLNSTGDNLEHLNNIIEEAQTSNI